MVLDVLKSRHCQRLENIYAICSRLNRFTVAQAFLQSLRNICERSKEFVIAQRVLVVDRL